MGIFTRFRDIVSANINAMLDNAEDPEKMIRLMIREMEDTLVEIKTSCAGVMANCKSVRRQASDAKAREKDWQSKAELAVSRERDDLAREALIEKRRHGQRANSLENELAELDELVDKYKSDIRQLEEKLGAAREKQRLLIQRHIHARKKRQVQEEIRKVDSTKSIQKFDEYESRIDRMEADADLVNYGKQQSLESKIDKLLSDAEIEEELSALKNKHTDDDHRTS